MTYVKQTWINGVLGATPISADRLGYIENGIAATDLAVTTHQHPDATKKLSAYTTPDACQVDDITVNVGDRVITSAGAARFLTRAKVGMSIMVGGAGGSPTTGLRTTISQVISDTQIQLTATPTSSQTASGASWGTDAGPGLLAALNEAVGPTVTSSVRDSKAAVYIDGAYLIFTDVFFVATSQTSRVHLLGQGPGSHIINATGSASPNNSAITITGSEAVLVYGIRFTGTRYVAVDGKATLYIGTAPAGAVVQYCAFLGLGGSLAVLMFNNSLIVVKDNNFIGCTTSTADSGVIRLLGTNIGAVIEDTQIIDVATTEGIGWSTAVKTTPTACWIKVEDPNATVRTSARSQTGLYFRNVILDEAANIAIRILPAVGTRWHRIEMDGVQINGGFNTTDFVAAVSITRAGHVRIRNFWTASVTAHTGTESGIELIDAGVVELEQCQLAAFMTNITADAATVSLILDDCTFGVLTSSCPTTVLTNGKGNRPLFTKAGVISDADFAVAPPIGTMALNTTASTFYIRIAAATWKSVALT